MNASGTEVEIDSDYYAYNMLGTQVKVLRGYIDCIDGRKVEVTPDAVTVTYSDGSKVTYVRFATELFRKFYTTLLTGQIENSYEMSKEDEAALLAPESGAWQLTLTIKDTEGGTKVVSFYELTPLKSYITINGNGGFYVMTTRVNKFASDAQKFFANQEIDPNAKK